MAKKKTKKGRVKKQYHDLMGSAHGHTALLIVIFVLLLLIAPQMLFAGNGPDNSRSVIKQLESHQESIDELLEDVTDLKQTSSGMLTQIALLFDTYVTSDELDNELDDLEDQLDDLQSCRLECPGELEPVCGFNDKTYLNDCEAECAGISIYELGQCGSAPSPICTPSTEVCDSKDNDCDGDVDEGFNFDSDENNCGSCGNTCSSGSSCINGECVLPEQCDIINNAAFFYDFSESSNPILSKSNSGTVAYYEEGATQDSLGDGSADLSASGAHINSNVKMFSDSPGDFTIAFDYYYDGTSPEGKGIMTCGASVNDCGIEWDSGDLLRFRLPGGWQEAYDISSHISNEDSWYSFFFAYDASANDMRLYIDGEEISSTYKDSQEVSTTNYYLKLGLFHDNPDLYSIGNNNEVWDNWFFSQEFILQADYPDDTSSCTG